MVRLIARQPVLDRYERVYGYELFPRPGEEEIWLPKIEGAPGEAATTGNSDLEWLDEITEGERAFVKCGHQELVSGEAAKFPRDRVVLEVPVAGGCDEELVAACRNLKAGGFTLALGGFNGMGEEPLADIADIIVLDVTASPERMQWLLMRRYRPRGAIFLASRVDKRQQFQSALQQGFTYFQGSFYTRPDPHSAGDVSPTKLVYLLVLGAVTKTEFDIQEVAEAIKHDLGLSFKLLRFLNSARFAFHSQIKSIRHALLMLGENEIRKWIGLISVTALGEGSPPILVSMALIRASFCELLAPLVGGQKRQADYFFLGLLSCIDVLTRRPMRAVLAELPLAPDVGAALVGEPNLLGDVLQVVLSYEQGNWAQFSSLAKKLSLTEEMLGQLHMQALRWSRELSQDQKGEPAAVTVS